MKKTAGIGACAAAVAALFAWQAGAAAQESGANALITAADCTAAKVGTSIAPIDTSPTSRPINFSVVLPASWSRRAAQLGGGGMNGVVPNLTDGPGGTSPLARGLATYGSDSGHQGSFGGRRGGGPPAAGATSSDDWTLNEEAIANLGYIITTRPSWIAWAAQRWIDSRVCS